ncbi:hypothetical protein DLM78_18695 [Leptospira stimsonii]|uniref:Uncharacterized protein n=1 Tax=Leptospira stimsonii TaxID=2202203 RepID=A0A8B3CN23_9LEPT|nr:hypothetical protein DLM78_18695 [Leptospira stimsonii]
MIQIQDALENRNPFFRFSDLLFPLKKEESSFENVLGKKNFYTMRSLPIENRSIRMRLILFKRLVRIERFAFGLNQNRFRRYVLI